jgi:hypothetical protein
MGNGEWGMGNGECNACHAAKAEGDDVSAKWPFIIAFFPIGVTL